MSEGMIIRRGGGASLKATDALLRVQAPAGSTVTITKGSVSKTDLGHENADDHTVYDYYFIIHQSQFDSVNPWTITATLGEDTASDTIIIDTADEYDVELSYVFYLFRSGRGALVEFGWNNNGSDVVTTVTDEMISQQYSGSSHQGSFFTENRIDWTPYRTLHVRLKCTSEPYNNDNFGLRINITNTYHQTGNATNPSRITGTGINVSSDYVEYTLNVATVNAEYYLNIWGLGSWTCTHIWATED